MKKFLLRLLLALALLVCAGLYVYLLAENGQINLNDLFASRFAVHGIDISRHQGKIRWAEVDTKKVNFVFIKSTEGSTFRDDQYSENLAGALRAGIPAGAYHFYSLCVDPLEQARNFLDYTKQFKNNSLPPAIDLEYGGNCKTRPSKSAFRKDLTSFLNVLGSNGLCKPIFYVTAAFYRDYLQSSEFDNAIWAREIIGMPRFLKGKSWLFWQYSSRSKFAGIDGFVDQNVLQNNFGLIQFLESCKH